jgi:hypothetical protein
LEGVHDFEPTRENKHKKIEEGKMIFKEIMNPTTSFHFDQQTGEYMFNNQSVSQEVEWMANAYITQDFKRMGFLLGHTIDKHAWSKQDYMDKMNSQNRY